MNGCPVSQYVWQAKEPSLLKGNEFRAKVKKIQLFAGYDKVFHLSKIVSSGTKNRKRNKIENKQSNNRIY